MLHAPKLLTTTVLLGCCGAALVSAGLALAFVLSGQDWTNQANPMGETYVVLGNTSDTVGELAAIQAAAATWNADCARFDFTYGGSQANAAPALDNVNQIRWGTTSGSLATTTWWYNTGTGDILEADAVFDDAYTWSTATPTPAGQFDIESVMLHEFGHYLSLGHSTAPAIMQPSIPAAIQRRALTADDQNGIRAIYGGCSNIRMKDGTLDTGLEPDPAMNTFPMWESPYIWVRNPNPDGAAFPLQHMNPEIGSPNYVYVEVRNDGTISPPGWLKLYYADGNTNLNNPGQWIPIGSQPLTPASGIATTVQFQWTNMPSSGGHYCLLAFWTETNAPLSFSDVNQAVRNSNDLIWRNVNVVDLLPKVQTDSDKARVFDVSLRGLAKGDSYLVFMGEPHAGRKIPWGRVARLTFTLGPEIAARAKSLGGNIRALDGGRFELLLDGRTASLGPLILKPGANAKMGIRVETDREMIQKLADGLTETAIFALRVIQASKGGAELLVRGESRVFDRPGLVAGGVTYHLTIRAPNGTAQTVVIPNLPMQGGNEKTPCPGLAVDYPRSVASSVPYLNIMLPNLDQQCATKGPGFKLLSIKFKTCGADPRGPGFGPNATADLTCG